MPHTMIYAHPRPELSESTNFSDGSPFASDALSNDRRITFMRNVIITALLEA
jgi:hypothetical protein